MKRGIATLVGIIQFRTVIGGAEKHQRTFKILTVETTQPLDKIIVHAGPFPGSRHIKLAPHTTPPVSSYPGRSSDHLYKQHTNDTLPFNQCGD